MWHVSLFNVIGDRSGVASTQFLEHDVYVHVTSLIFFTQSRLGCLVVNSDRDLSEEIHGKFMESSCA